MENLTVEGDDMHPQINLNAENNLIQIIGISRPENPKVYFSKTFEWIRSYFDEEGFEKVTLEMTLEYFNTASSKILLDLLELLEAYHEKGKQIHVLWCDEEDDDELLEAGEEFFELVELSHEYKVID